MYPIHVPHIFFIYPAYVLYILVLDVSETLIPGRERSKTRARTRTHAHTHTHARTHTHTLSLSRPPPPPLPSISLSHPPTHMTGDTKVTKLVLGVPDTCPTYVLIYPTYVLYILYMTGDAKVTKLDWSADNALRFQEQRTAPIDLILASEVAYCEVRRMPVEICTLNDDVYP